MQRGSYYQRGGEPQAPSRLVYSHRRAVFEGGCGSRRAHETVEQDARGLYSRSMLHGCEAGIKRLGEALMETEDRESTGATMGNLETMP